MSSSLLDLLRKDDPEAWGRLVRVFGPLVYKWCRKSGLQPADASDVGQEVFRAVVRSIARFHRDGAGDSFRGWLSTITRNKIRDHWRKRRSEPEAFGGTDAQERLAREPAEHLEDSVSAVDTGDLGSACHRALDLIRGEFGEHTWQAFWKVAVDRKTPAETAADLGMSINAVYLAKSRVLRRLRIEFGDLLG